MENKKEYSKSWSKILQVILEIDSRSFQSQPSTSNYEMSQQLGGGKMKDKERQVIKDKFHVRAIVSFDTFSPVSFDTSSPVSSDTSSPGSALSPALLLLRVSDQATLLVSFQLFKCCRECLMSLLTSRLFSFYSILSLSLS